MNIIRLIKKKDLRVEKTFAKPETVKAEKIMP